MVTWSTACPDWERRIVEGESLITFPPLFPAVAEHALAVFKSLKATEVKKKPNGEYQTLGEVCDDFVFDLVGALFGAEDPDSQERLIKEALLLISKKNGKSMIAAGIMLTAMIINWRDFQEMLILAPTMEVANNSFIPLKGMIHADEELVALFHIVENQRLVRHRVTNATLKVVAADGDTVSGKKAGFVLVEELWLFGKRANAGAMLAEATGGLSARPEGFVLFITTHSDEPPSGVFKDKLHYARDVRDGKVDDPTFLPMLYEWPEAMIEAEAYLQPANFYVTNPHIDRSVTREWLERQLAQAQAGEGAGLQVFLAKHLNVEIGMRQHRDRWKGADFWERTADPKITLDELLRRSEVVVVGIDGGGMDDLLGCSVLGREKGSQRWLSWSCAWVDSFVLSYRPVIAEQLRDFAKDGDLILCDDMVEDVAMLADFCRRIYDSGLMPAKDGFGIDPGGIGNILQELHDVGIPPDLIIGVPQGWRLSASVETAARKLKRGALRHAEQGLMTFAVANAKAMTRGNNLIIDKEISGRSKIDPLMALFNAVFLMNANPDPAGSNVSPYEERGLIRI